MSRNGRSKACAGVTVCCACDSYISLNKRLQLISLKDFLLLMLHVAVRLDGIFSFASLLIRSIHVSCAQVWSGFLLVFLFLQRIGFLFFVLFLASFCSFSIFIGIFLFLSSLSFYLRLLLFPYWSSSFFFYISRFFIASILSYWVSSILIFFVSTFFLIQSTFFVYLKIIFYIHV